MAFQKTPGRKFGDRRGGKTFRDNRFLRAGEKPGSSSRSAERRPREKSFSKGSLELFDATCAKCGKRCQVPFKPTAGGKPVLCRDCFRNDGGGRDFAPRSSSSAQGVSSTELAEIHEKLDKIMKALDIE